MVFASLSFLFFLFPLYLITDAAGRMCRSTAARNAALLAVSLLFYVWGEAASVFILLAMGVFNYIAGRFIARGCRKFIVAGAIAINLGLLFGYKYAAWLLSLVIPDISSGSSMPLGISFFTFHAVSYLIDVYRRHVPPAGGILEFLTYFCMFPHLVAGPIVRFAHVREDLAARGPDRDLFSFGMYRFLLGLNKKIIIADSVAVVADSAFKVSALGSLSSADAWMGAAAYAVQIYFDFSAYSDMAIGLAAMGGFHFEENFKRPYSAVSIRDFWRRWHISLSSWLRDYLFIPLGGSRVSRAATYRNLLIVFFLCGLWHGANVTFIVWGLWHGLFLIIERVFSGERFARVPAVCKRGYALLVVLLGWVFFRAESLPAAAKYFADMFRFSFDFTAPILTYHVVGTLALVAGIALCLLPDKLLPQPSSRTPGAVPFGALLFQAALAVLSVGLMLVGARSPFIYFNF